jgi:hypothetical protein
MCNFHLLQVMSFCPDLCGHGADRLLLQTNILQWHRAVWQTYKEISDDPSKCVFVCVYIYLVGSVRSSQATVHGVTLQKSNLYIHIYENHRKWINSDFSHVKKFKLGLNWQKS